MPADPEALEAIRNADAIIVGPGDLYTSLVASLLPTGLRDAIQASSAKLIFITNLFTKAGQSSGMSARAHVKAIETYAGRAPDVIILHEGEVSEEAARKYKEEGEEPVLDDLRDAPSVVRAKIASEHIVPPLPQDPLPRSLVRHDSDKLRAVIEPLLS